MPGRCGWAMGSIKHVGTCRWGAVTCWWGLEHVVSERRRAWLGLGMHGWGLGGIAGGQETVWVAAGMWVGAGTPEGAGTARWAGGGQTGCWVNGPLRMVSGGWANGWARGSGWWANVDGQTGGVHSTKILIKLVVQSSKSYFL